MKYILIIWVLGYHAKSADVHSIEFDTFEACAYAQRQTDLKDLDGNFQFISKCLPKGENK